jgi:anti-anti-sigma factor
LEIEARDGVSFVRVGKNQLRGKASQQLFENLQGRLARDLITVIDLSEVLLVDSIGLGVLVKLAKVQKDGCRRFAVCGMKPQVRSTFTQLHLHKVIPVFQDADHAKNGLT